MTGEPEDPRPPLQEGDRVRINPDFPGRWAPGDLKRLTDRKGTVLAIEGGRIDVIWDKRHLRGAQTVHAFFNPDQLLRIED